MKALYASLADLIWVISSLVLLLLGSSLFTTLGIGLIAAVAVAVSGFGAWQLWAIGIAHRVTAGERQGWYRHCVAVETDVEPEAMWNTIAGLGEIKRYMPSLRESRLESGSEPSVGSVRTCEHDSGKRWSEECIVFEPGKSFTVRFVSEAPDFPYPAKAMYGGWQVHSSKTGSEVRVWWELIPKVKFWAPVVLAILAWRADRDFPQVIGRMAAASQPGNDAESQATSAGRPDALARLLPQMC